MNELLAFNIMIEAKTRALVYMTRKYHPEFEDDDIHDFLITAIEHALLKEQQK